MYLCGGVEAIKGLSGEKNVAFGASGEGLVTLPQDHKCVLNVAFQKIDMEVGPARCPPLEPLHWLLYGVRCTASLGKIISSYGPPQGVKVVGDSSTHFRYRTRCCRRY